MCLMDWRLGRFVKSVNHSSVQNGAGVVSIPANAQRVGLTIWGTPAGSRQLLDPTISAVGAGLAGTSSTNTPIHLTIATHGDLVTKAINTADLDTNGQTLYWTEYLMPEQVLAKADELLRREGFF